MIEIWLMVDRDFVDRRTAVLINITSYILALYCTNFISKFALGLRFSIEGLKSFIIPFAVIEKHLSLDDAIFLARLESQLQVCIIFFVVSF